MPYFTVSGIKHESSCGHCGADAMVEADDRAGALAIVAAFLAKHYDFYPPADFSEAVVHQVISTDGMIRFNANNH